MKRNIYCRIHATFVSIRAGQKIPVNSENPLKGRGQINGLVLLKNFMGGRGRLYITFSKPV